MKNIDRIEINKFSHLHDEKNIFFCKTDYILEDFKNISELDHPVALITGNSDYAITDEIVSLAPKNIFSWYAQNAISNSEILHPIPLGLENKIPSVRDGHGIGYFDRASKKEQLLNSITNNNPTKLIYANFNINTNYNYRSIVKKYCIDSSFIDWEEPNLSLSQFFNKITDYKMVVCPAGNGVDTHRLWETLYCGQIPITIVVGEYKIYELYKELPIILLNNIRDLLDYDLIMQKYQECQSKNFNEELLNTNYWINIIKDNTNEQ